MSKKKAEGGVRKFWHGLGPGFITGAADDDPAGIATYSQAGAKTGNKLLWLASFTFPLMAVVQEMCARIGLVTGKGLAGNIKAHYPRHILYVCTLLLFIANVFNIGADLGAMAKSTQLILPQIDFWGLIFFFAIVSVVLEVFISYKVYARYLKYLAYILFVYVITAFFLKIDWIDAVTHLAMPAIEFSGEQILLVCAILGTTISPYLFFWQTSEEVEEEIAKGKTTVHQRRGASESDIKEMREDIWIGMFISNLIMFFIILVASAALFSNGVTNIDTAADAASALRPLAGEYAFLLFAIGVIGTGLLTIPILAASASYAVSESFKWREGLYRKPKEALAFYGIIALTVFIGMLIDFVGLDPIKALIYSAIINGLIAPVVLVLIIHMSSNGKIMGKWKNGRYMNAAGWLIAIGMSVVAVVSLAYLAGL